MLMNRRGFHYDEPEVNRVLVVNISHTKTASSRVMHIITTSFPFPEEHSKAEYSSDNEDDSILGKKNKDEELKKEQ